MASGGPAPDNQAAREIREEIHELAVLSNALLRLAMKVQTRCEALRNRLGSLDPVDEAELNRYVSWVAEPPAAEDRSARPPSDEIEPAALLAMSLSGEGMSREQIGNYLRDSFGMHDAEELLERVLPQSR